MPPNSFFSTGLEPKRTTQATLPASSPPTAAVSVTRPHLGTISKLQQHLVFVNKWKRWKSIASLGVLCDNDASFRFLDSTSFICFQSIQLHLLSYKSFIIILSAAMPPRPCSARCILLLCAGRNACDIFTSSQHCS